MGENISITEEKSRVRALINAGAVLLLTYFSFWGISVFCFALLEGAYALGLIAGNGLNCEWAKVFYNPFYIAEIYVNWWNELVLNMRLMQFSLLLLIPIVVPVVMGGTLVFAFLDRKYSFKLWYILTYHFAKHSDVEKMGIIGNEGIVLGKFAGDILSTKKSESVLCVGEMGTGKTSNEAIPSMLNADGFSIIAMDLTGALPKYTAGYRATLGKVFYYNWDLVDEPDKNLFYPRWNPLCHKNIPQNPDDKKAYIKRIAKYIIDVNEKEKNTYWNLLAYTFITAILEFWTAKVTQAKANDYFLEKIISGKHLSKEDKEILMSYYIHMPDNYAQKAIDLLLSNTVDEENYMPIGSWAGIPEPWCGKDVCFAAITDWLIDNYITNKDDEKRDWKSWVVSLYNEAMLFGYGELAVEGFNKIIMLSPKQRQIAFVYTLRPFKIFTNPSVRERTDGNDFDFDFIKGMVDEKDGLLKPVTVYSLANSYPSKILNQIFVDEILYRNLNEKDNIDALPVMLVLDDVGHNLRIRNLSSLLESGKKTKAAALLLCNSLDLLEETYGHDDLETIVSCSEYKIIKAKNNRLLSNQFYKLANFATKTVQISQYKEKLKRYDGKYFANTYYFEKLAHYFELDNDVDTKDCQILLAEGFYNRPILADNILVNDDDAFKKLLVLDTDYTLSDEVMFNKTAKDLNTPKIRDMFNKMRLKPEELQELQENFDFTFNEVDELNKQDRAEIENKIKEKKQAIKEKQNKIQTDEKDWWMKEGAFDVYEKDDKNPFALKK